MEAERHRFEADGLELYIPPFIQEIIAEITHLARRSPDVNQKSGVSVRVSIANYETVIGNAQRRAVVLNEKMVVPRVSDLPYIHASTDGKIELESLDEVREGKVVDDLIKKAVASVFNRYRDSEESQAVLAPFNEGFAVEVSDMMEARKYLETLKKVGGLGGMVKRLNLPERAEAQASGVEFILEGLYANNLLKKSRVDNKVIYRR